MPSSSPRAHGHPGAGRSFRAHPPTTPTSIPPGTHPLQETMRFAATHGRRRRSTRTGTTGVAALPRTPPHQGTVADLYNASTEWGRRFDQMSVSSGRRLRPRGINSDFASVCVAAVLDAIRRSGRRAVGSQPRLPTRPGTTPVATASSPHAQPQLAGPTRNAYPRGQRTS